MFFEDLRSTRLLNKDEERELGALVQQLMGWEEQRKALAHELGREPTLGEWAACAGVDAAEMERQVQAGYNAKRLMVECNLRLVVSIGRKYQNNGVPLSDLVQEGAVGLVRAAEKFDPARGFKFSTYATWWVRQRMQLALRSQRLVRVPLRLQDHWFAISRARKALEGELDRRPTDAELAERVGLTVAQVAHVKRIMRAPLSLDRTVRFTSYKSESGAVQMADLVASSGALPDHTVEWALLRDELEVCMQRELNQLERDIIRMRSGLDDGRAKSAAELSGVLKIPARVILREERNALSKLRLAQATHVLKDFTEVAETRL